MTRPGIAAQAVRISFRKDRLVAPAMFDVGKALLPLRGELHILQLVDGDTDEHPPGGSATDLLAFTLQVAAFDQALENAGAGRGRADASRMARVVIQGGFQIAVRDETARMLHGGQQCGLRERFRRRGHALRKRRGAGLGERTLP